MSAFAAAAQDEDGDTISALRAENEQLRQALLTANDTLVKASQAGAHHARAAECLRKTVIRWAARAEQAEEMLEAIGAGGVGSKVARQDHHEQHLNMVPEGWKLVPVEPTIPMLHRADGLTLHGHPKESKIRQREVLKGFAALHSAFSCRLLSCWP